MCSFSLGSCIQEAVVPRASVGEMLRAATCYNLAALPVLSLGLCVCSILVLKSYSCQHAVKREVFNTLSFSPLSFMILVDVLDFLSFPSCLTFFFGLLQLSIGCFRACEHVSM